MDLLLVEAPKDKIFICCFLSTKHATDSPSRPIPCYYSSYAFRLCLSAIPLVPLSSVEHHDLTESPLETVSVAKFSEAEGTSGFLLLILAHRIKASENTAPDILIPMAPDLLSDSGRSQAFPFGTPARQRYHFVEWPRQSVRNHRDELST